MLCIYTHLLDDWQDPRLVIVVTVRANTEIDLSRMLVCLVRGGELENATGKKIGECRNKWARIGQTCLVAPKAQIAMTLLMPLGLSSLKYARGVD